MEPITAEEYLKLTPEQRRAHVARFNGRSNQPEPETARPVKTMTTYLIESPEGPRGPYTLSQMRALWSAGGLTINNRFRETDIEEWASLSELVPLLESASSQSRANSDAPEGGWIHANKKPAPAVVDDMGMTKFVVGAFAVLLMIIVVGISVTNSVNEPAKPETPQYSSLMWSTAEQAVRARLKAPGSADFVDAARTFKQDGSGWLLAGQVDAVNSFGAKLRGTWAVRLVSDGAGGWTAEEVKIN